jgi:predicted dienelactone hydrolase
VIFVTAGLERRFFVRVLETLLLGLLLVAVSTWIFLPATKRLSWLRLECVIGLLLLAAHCLIEGWRWAMVPTYVLVTFLVLVSAFPHLTNQTSSPAPAAGRLSRVVISSIILIGFVFAISLPILFPVFSLPKPSGPFSVGTIDMAFTDPSRTEEFSDVFTGFRNVMIRIWYPASSEKPAKPRFLWERAEELAPRLSAAMSLPSFIFDQLNMVRSHSYPTASVSNSEAAYPVVLFSHGYSAGSVSQNTVQMEQLASNGYIVVSISHPYESLIVNYPDGHKVPVSEARTAIVDKELTKDAELADQLTTTTEINRRMAILSQWSKALPAINESAQVWTADTSFILDELGRMNSGAIRCQFTGKLDMSRVGVFGMSFGGLTAGAVCLLDSRCKAGIDLDGFQVGISAQGPLRVPFMFMSSEPNARRNETVYELAENDTYYLIVKGSRHYDFTDFSMISPVMHWLGVSGSINPRQMEEIMNTYVLSFFDQYLKGSPASLLQTQSSPYPEVIFKSRLPAAGNSHNGNSGKVGT